MLLVMSLAHPEFEGSVNPISTGGRLCPPHFTACPSGFETLTVSLVFNISHYRGSFDKFLCPNPSFKSQFVEIIEYLPTYFIFGIQYAILRKQQKRLYWKVSPSWNLLQKNFLTSICQENSNWETAMLLHCYKSLLEFFGKNQLGNKIQKDSVKEKNKSEASVAF